MPNVITQNPDGTKTEHEMEGDELDWYQAAVADIESTKAAEEAAATQKATDQANGNQKLLDLGLTQEEATALTGYVPPSE